MISAASVVLLGMLMAWPTALSSQERKPGKPAGTPGARMPESFRKDVDELISRGAYEKAVTALESTDATYQDDPEWYTLLGKAYLYSSDRLNGSALFARASDAMQKAIEMGGDAVFIVDRSKDRG